MIFNLKRNFVCVFCGGKRNSGQRFRYNCGICEECAKKVPFTPEGGSFEGGKYIKYVIAPMFYEDYARDAIMRYKFDGWTCCEDVFGHIMAQHVQSFEHLRAFDMVIPVPLSEQRFNERGFNQSVPLAQAVASELGIEYCEDALIKVRNTKKQSKLSARERLENVRGAYRAQRPISGKRIILTDDIYTTGITMDECAGTLIDAGASEVVAVTLSIKPRKEKNPYLRY